MEVPPAGSKMAQDGPKMGPERPQDASRYLSWSRGRRHDQKQPFSFSRLQVFPVFVALDVPKMHPRGPQLTPRWPKIAPTWAQRGPKIAPSWPQVASRYLSWSNGRRHKQKLWFSCCFAPFLRNTMAPRGPQLAPRWPKMAPRWAQRGPRIAPRWPQDASRCLKIPILVQRTST